MFVWSWDEYLYCAAFDVSYYYVFMLSPICYAKWVWAYFTEANETINIFTLKEQLQLDNLNNYIFNDAVKANIDIMTPWYGHAFRITDHLWREFSVTGGFPSHSASNKALLFLLLLAWQNCWTNSQVAGGSGFYVADLEQHLGNLLKPHVFCCNSILRTKHLKLTWVCKNYDVFHDQKDNFST